MHNKPLDCVIGSGRALQKGTDLLIETIIASTIAGLLVFVIQRYFVFRQKLTFLGYPRVRGKYTVQYEEEASCKEVIEIRQLGSRISGKVKEINTGVEYSLTGNTTRSRYIIYQVYSKDINHNYFGAALLKLNKNGSEAKGFLLYVGADDSPIVLPGKIIRSENQ